MASSKVQHRQTSLLKWLEVAETNRADKILTTSGGSSLGKAIIGEDALLRFQKSESTLHKDRRWARLGEEQSEEKANDS